MNDKRYWVGFNLVKGIGALRLEALRDHFGDLAVACIERVSAGLVIKELKGLVRQGGGMNYVTVREQQTEYKV